jgi:hypothetical protein
MDTQTKNADISEFMGEQLDPLTVISESTKGRELWAELSRREMTTNVPPYHVSWDWIIPVVKKIRSTPEYNGFNVKTEEFNDGKIVIGLHTQNIEMLHDGVTEFIEWYKLNT